MTGRIKAVFFDYGNVLGTFDHMKACELLSRHSKSTAKEIYDFAFLGPIGALRETGKVSPEEFFNVMLKKFNFTGLTFSEFCAIWGDIFEQNPAIEEVVAGVVSEKRPVFVLSNTEELHWKYISRLPVMQRYFFELSRQVLSFQIWRKKPDVAIFNEAIRRSGFSPSQIVYFDDAPAYAETFRGLGGNAFVYDGRTDPVGILTQGLSL